MHDKKTIFKTVGCVVCGEPKLKGNLCFCSSCYLQTRADHPHAFPIETLLEWVNSHTLMECSCGNQIYDLDYLCKDCRHV